MPNIVLSGAFALALLLPAAASAATDQELAEIRGQIRELREAYEARIQALERRLKEAEEKATRTPAPVAAVAPPPAAASVPATASNAFNPALSMVLQGRYANLSQDPSSFAIAGFAPRGEIGPGPRGFSLAESEITMRANVDHKFGGVLTFALSPEDTVSVEEAYGPMIAPVHGVTPKFGRFLSGIGYLNEQHQHAWDFVDAPLAYQAFLGGAFRNDGVQLKWLAPTEHYVELGAEAGNGNAFPGTGTSRNGLGSAAAYVHTGGDIGESHSWRAGLSYLRTRGDETTEAARLAIADFVWKWAPNGNPRERNFKLQGEYFRQEQGAWRPKGGYVQAVYQFMPEWRIGARFDRLDPAAEFHPKRSSVMVDWSPSEFSRVRLQFARSLVQPEITDNQWFVQYILSLGAHGAHRY